MIEDRWQKEITKANEADTVKGITIANLQKGVPLQKAL